MATIHSTCTLMQIHAIGLFVLRVRLVSMADRRTERLRLLLTVSNKTIVTVSLIYRIQPVLVSVGFPKK